MATIKGGDKLAKKLAQISTQLKRPGTLRVGFLEGATYPDGTPVAEIAAIHNFGAPRAGIPRRPFFTNMVKKESPEWPKTMGVILKQTNYDTPRTLELMGEGIKGQLQQSIHDTNTPPLAESTVARKGFAKPLIDKSIMINSADYEVS